MTRFVIGLLIIIFVYSCNDTNHCLSDYSNSPVKLGLTIDSVNNKSHDCVYYTTIPLCQGKEIVDFEGEMYVKDSIFYYRITEKPYSEYFPLFDLTKRSDYLVNIVFSEVYEMQTQDTVYIKLGQIIKTKEDKKVFVFRLSGLYCYEGNQFDGTFFVNYEQGIIGSYLYMKDEEDKEYFAYPEGNIFEDKIDYSNFTHFKLL